MRAPWIERVGSWKRFESSFCGLGVPGAILLKLCHSAGLELGAKDAVARGNSSQTVRVSCRASSLSGLPAFTGWAVCDYSDEMIA